MKLATLAALAALGAILSGCASIVEGTTQSIAVTSPPTDGAKCVLTSSEGTYYLATPGNTTVHKTKNDLDVICKKDGFKDAHATIPSHFNGATAGNILAGGVIGIGIDAATGANYNYPTEFAVTMVPSESAPIASLPPPATPPTPADAKPAEATPPVSKPAS
jgi:phosphoketolase